MDKFADKYLIRSTRLNNFNYSNQGIYFITICTLHHNNFFGKIFGNMMVLSEIGVIANQCLSSIPIHFQDICLETFVIMPNHVHILVHVETPYMASLQDNRKISLINYGHKNHPDFYLRLSQKSKQLIPKMIQQFKSSVTRQINPKTIFFGWQPRYHDVIVKDSRQFTTIKNYITDNPAKWQKDKYYTNQ
jgi:putative transposase